MKRLNDFRYKQEHEECIYFSSIKNLITDDPSVGSMPNEDETFTFYLS